MTWRDDPRIIWQDEDGDCLWCFAGSGGRGDLAIGDWNGIGEAIDAPDSPAEWDELLHRLAAVAGRRITGIEDAPRPIEVGDLVHWAGVKGTFEVRHIDGDQALIRDPLDTRAYAARMVELRHVEAGAPGSEPDPGPEGEPEMVWIEQGETPDDEWNEMLGAALGNDCRVEYYADGEWVPPSATARAFRWFGPFSEVRYRIEVHSDEAWLWRTGAYIGVLAAEEELDGRPPNALSGEEFLNSLTVEPDPEGEGEAQSIEQDDHPNAGRSEVLADALEDVLQQIRASEKELDGRPQRASSGDDLIRLLGFTDSRNEKIDDGEVS